MWLLFLLCTLSSEPAANFATLDPARYLVNPISRVTSPTALACVEGQLYLGCDVLETLPGIYRLYSKNGVLTAGSFHNVPQEMVEGLAADTNAFYVTSARSYSSDPDHWKGKVLSFDARTRRQTDVLAVDIDSKCSDGSYDCGLVAAVKLDEETWLLATKQNTAELIVLKHAKTGWVKAQSLPISVEGHAAVISELRLIGDELFFLARNRWVISSFAIKDLYAENAWQVKTTVRFDLSELRKKFPVTSLGVMADGFAEGFVFDDAGQLHVLLNNRGFAYENGSQLEGQSQPLLITYTPSRAKTPQAPAVPEPK